MIIEFLKPNFKKIIIFVVLLLVFWLVGNFYFDTITITRSTGEKVVVRIVSDVYGVALVDIYQSFILIPLLPIYLISCVIGYTLDKVIKK